MFFTKEIRKIIDDEKIKIYGDMKECEFQINQKIDKLPSTNLDSDLLKKIPSIVSRIEDIELWRSKIHTLLTTTSVMNNEDKLSKAGRKFALLFNQKK